MLSPRPGYRSADRRRDPGAPASRPGSVACPTCAGSASRPWCHVVDGLPPMISKVWPLYQLIRSAMVCMSRALNRWTYSCCCGGVACAPVAAHDQLGDQVEIGRLVEELLELARVSGRPGLRWTQDRERAVAEYLDERLRGCLAGLASAAGSRRAQSSGRSRRPAPGCVARAWCRQGRWPVPSVMSFLVVLEDVVVVAAGWPRAAPLRISAARFGCRSCGWWRRGRCCWPAGRRSARCWPRAR